MAITFNGKPAFPGLAWNGALESIVEDEDGMRACLLQPEKPLWVVRVGPRVGLTNEGGLTATSAGSAEAVEVLAYAPPVTAAALGDPAFCARYGTKYAYYAGAMANGIASEEMVIALGQAGLLGSFGSAGLAPARVEAAITKIQAALPDGPYAFNLINSPNEPALEQQIAGLYLRQRVTTVEASAYLELTLPLVYYRAAGLAEGSRGEVLARNRVIAKLSRREVARQFMEPAPLEMLKALVQDGRITARQAELAQRVPVADDVTAEADSGGHTDNRPLVGLVPTILALRDEIQARQQYPQAVRVGAGGGISTPGSTLAAFMMGAAYVVTGSVNQACVESGASEQTRKVLAQAGMADVIMAPAADMFEMGVKVQLLKRGTLYPMRAQKLYELYTRYNSIEEIPLEERTKLEKTVFKRDFNTIWEDTVGFFNQRDPRQVERANREPHHKMALIFRWYLGLSSRWSVSGEKGREMDYQIWCGPAMGVFNEWSQGTYLAEPANRRVVDVALQLMNGAAVLARLRTLSLQGVRFPSKMEQVAPVRPE